MIEDKIYHLMKKNSLSKKEQYAINMIKNIYMVLTVNITIESLTYI